MENITSKAYWDEIKSAASYIADEYNESDDWYDAIHEYVDSHQWIIYTAYHADLVRNTDHPDAYLDMMSNEDIGNVVRDNGLEHAIMIQAFYAMQQDIIDALDDMDS